MRIVDLFMAVPILLLALLVLYVLGSNLLNIVIVFAVLRWMLYCRVARAAVLSLRDQPFTEAARALGASQARILVRHILPNIGAPLLTVATLEVARVILAESTLSFLGMGIQPPQASWGLILAQGRTYITTAWWLVAMPGFAIFFTVLSFNLVGVWLRAVTDPVQRWRWMKIPKPGEG
jgi:peptide/nickel transport system permease protein